MEPRKVIVCTFLVIFHLQLITSFKVPYQPNHQDNEGYNYKAQKSENNEYNWEDEADSVDTLNGGTVIPTSPDTNWMTPVPWSPDRNEEKHESLGTEEESENSKETGSAETDWWSETGEESENSEETGSAETDWWSETEEQSENSEDIGSAETDWWSETEEESENAEEKYTKKNWWSSWNHGKNQEKQHIKSDLYQNYMESSETHDSYGSQEEADMGGFAKLAKGLFGSAGAFGGLNAEVESMEVNMSGLRMETGFAASGNGGQSNITEKMNVNQMAVAPPRDTEGGIVSSLNFAIDKIEMKLNGLKIEMGGGEGMQGPTEGSTPSNIHEAMMKSYFRHMESKNGEYSD